MKELVYRKKIIIPYCGYISLLKLRGPIDKPYMETVDNINKLIMAPYPVYEVLNDGSFVELNIQNFDKENGPIDSPAMVVSMESMVVVKKTTDSFVQSFGDEDSLKAKQIKMIKASTDKLSPKISGDIESKTTENNVQVVKLNNNSQNNKKKKYQIDEVEKK